MKPKFKKGQVVRMDTEFYKYERKSEQYQKIVKVWKWENAKGATPKYGYTLANKDECNEKYLKPLTETERG